MHFCSGPPMQYCSGVDSLPATTLVTQPMPELSWCCETLEAYELEGEHIAPYDLDSADEYPAGLVAFTNIAVTTDGGDHGGSWLASDTVKNYGEHTLVAENNATAGEVDIYFGRGEIA